MPGVVTTRIPFLNALAGAARVEPVLFSMDPRQVGRAEAHVSWDDASFEVRHPHGWSFAHRTDAGDVWPVHVRPSLHWDLARGGFEAFVTLQWNALYTMPTIVQGRLSRRPVVLWEESIQHAPTPWKLRLAPGIRLMFRQFDASIAASARCKAYLLELGARPGTVFESRTPIDVDDYRAPLASMDGRAYALLRERYGLDGRVPILFVGNLTQRKGVHELLTAFEEVVRASPKTLLLLAGSGPEEACLRRRVVEAGLGDCVRFVGFLSHQELPLLGALAAAFVLPSRYDAWPAAVLEAMSVGLPIVTTDAVGMVPEIVRDGENGLVVPVNAPSALAQALLRVTSSPGECRRMGERSLELIRSWTVRDAAAAFADAIEYAVETRRRPRGRTR